MNSDAETKEHQEKSSVEDKAFPSAGAGVTRKRDFFLNTYLPVILANQTPNCWRLIGFIGAPPNKGLRTSKQLLKHKARGVAGRGGSLKFVKLQKELI